VTQERDPGAEIGGLVVGDGFVEPGGELAERLAETAGEDDGGGTAGGVADVATGLTALWPGGDDGGIGAWPLSLTQAGDAGRLVGTRFIAERREKEESSQAKHARSSYASYSSFPNSVWERLTPNLCFEPCRETEFRRSA